MAHGRGRGHLCWWPLIFIKNFRYVIRLTGYRYNSNIFVTTFDLCFIGSVGFDGHLTDSSLASIFLLRPDWVLVGLPAYKNKLEIINKNSFLSQFISRRHRTDLHPWSISSR
jgi:hypothetical protein